MCNENDAEEYELDQLAGERELDDEPEELTCTTCNGSGEGMYDGTRCRSCNGSGIDPDSRAQPDDDCDPPEPEYCDEEGNILP